MRWVVRGTFKWKGRGGKREGTEKTTKRRRKSRRRRRGMAGGESLPMWRKWAFLKKKVTGRKREDCRFISGRCSIQSFKQSVDLLHTKPSCHPFTPTGGDQKLTEPSISPPAKGWSPLTSLEHWQTDRQTGRPRVVSGEVKLIMHKWCLYWQTKWLVLREK